MGSTLEVGLDLEAAKVTVIGAMLFPRGERLRAGYVLRNEWERRIKADPSIVATTAEIQALLDLPSRNELQVEAEMGVRRGTVAGDLLALIYEQSRRGDPEPSMRAAHRRYTSWAIGKKYGDSKSLKYSSGQLHRFFEEAAPSAHLWAAFRLLQNINDGGVSYRSAFEPNGLPLFLGVARSVEYFAANFIPKRTRPAKPVLDGSNLHRVPFHIKPIDLDF